MNYTQSSVIKRQASKTLPLIGLFAALAIGASDCSAAERPAVRKVCKATCDAAGVKCKKLVSEDNTPVFLGAKVDSCHKALNSCLWTCRR